MENRIQRDNLHCQVQFCLQRELAPVDALGRDNWCLPPSQGDSFPVYTGIHRAAHLRCIDQLVVRCPPFIRQAIDQAASRQLLRPSDYVRKAVVAQLRSDGIDLDQLTLANDPVEPTA